MRRFRASDISVRGDFKLLKFLVKELGGRWRTRADGGDRGVDPLPNMTIIMVMSDSTLPLAEIKKHLSEIIDGVETRHDRVVLTRNGRPAAVILSPDDLESLEETVEILSNPAAVRAIRKAETEIDKGKSFDAGDLRAKYLKR